MFRLISNKKPLYVNINFITNYVIALFLFVSILISSNNKIFDRVRGVDVFIQEVSEIINDNDLVISDRIIFSNFLYALNSKSNNIYMPYKKPSPITNHFQISSPFKKNHKNSFFLLGNLNDISYLTKKYQGRLVREFDVPFSSNSIELYEINFK